MSRKRFSERKVVETLIRQGAVIKCPRCRELITLADVPVIEREHFEERALGGADTPENCFFSHGTCHKHVTNGTRFNRAGSSKHKIAKAKRAPAKLIVARGLKPPRAPRLKAKTRRKPCPR